MNILSFHRYRPFFAPEGTGGGTSPDPTPSASTPTPSPSPAAPAATTPSGAPSTPSTPSTPSAPAAAPASTEPAVKSPDLGFDYGSIFEGPPERVESPVVVPVQPAAQPGVTPAPAAAAPAAPAGTEVAPPVPPQPMVQQTPGQQDTPPAPAASGPQYDPADPASLARALRENEAAAIEHVAQTMFTLSPEDIGALEADVAGTVPKLLARVMVRAQQQMFTLLSQFVPPMIQRQQEVQKRQAGHEDAFYKAWPNLDRAKHGDLVKSWGASYRKMHPDKPTSEMIQDLGKMAVSYTHLTLP